MIVVLLLLIFKLNSAHIEDYHDFDMDHQTPAPDGVLVFGFSGLFKKVLKLNEILHPHSFNFIIVTD